MEVEELIYNRLKQSEALAEKLTTYDKGPAVFYQTAPDDKQAAWNQKTQYPRVVFDLDKQANTERKSQGTLAVWVLCERTGIEPEEIEPLIRGNLENILIKPDGSFPFCFAWARTDGFEQGTAGLQRQVIGVEIRFDMLEFPKQETTDPDPVMALNCYIQDLYPEACVVGLTHMGRFTVLSREHPAFYCRFLRLRQEQITNTVVWVNADLVVHLICPDQEARMQLVMDLGNRVAVCGEINMLDRSPMRPTEITVELTADYLRTGQLNITFHYGLLRWRPMPHRITRVNIDIAKED